MFLLNSRVRNLPGIMGAFIHVTQKYIVLYWNWSVRLTKTWFLTGIINVTRQVSSHIGHVRHIK